MKNKYKLSVIIPIYNAENTIGRAINSILNQNWDGDVIKDIEIICVDDCSTDSTSDILKDYSSKYENVKYYAFSDNSGFASRGRNKGVELSTSDYIVFLDSDDEYLPNGLKSLYSAIISDDADFVASSARIDSSLLSRYFKICPKKYRKTKTYDVKDNIVRKEKLYEGIRVGAWSKIYNKNFLVNNGLKFRDITFEDFEFMLKCCLVANKIKAIPNEQTYMYYTYEDSMSHSHKLADFYSKLQVIRSMLNILKSNGIPEEYFMNSSFDTLYLLFFDVECSKEERKLLFEELCSLHKEVPSIKINTFPISLLEKPILNNDFEKAYKIAKFLKVIYNNKFLIKLFRDISILKN